MREKLFLGGVLLLIIGAVTLGWHFFPTPTIEYIDPDKLGSVSWQRMESEIWERGSGRPPGIRWEVWGEPVYAAPSASETGIELDWGGFLFLPNRIGLSSDHPIGFQLREEMRIFKVERKGDKLFVYEGRK